MRIIESMTRITLPDKTYIRVWRNEDEVKDTYDNSDLHTMTKMNPHLTMSQLAEKIATMPRVNAVEILTGDGAGVLIYPSWP